MSYTRRTECACVPVFDKIEAPTGRWRPWGVIRVGALKAWAGVVGAVCVGLMLAFAGSDGTSRAAGIPVFALCVAGAFAVQWLAFVPAYLLRTERFFDAVGAATFLALACAALATTGTVDLRAAVIGVLVGVWALRLGVFLAVRVHRTGGDRRFDAIKPDFAVFLMTWTLQGVWVVVSLGPGLAAIASTARAPADGFLVAGVVLWVAGFVVEVVADEQKRRFRRRPENAGRFIDTGLWAWSQHPNYLGEIVLWCGIAVAAFPALQGWQYATLVSPVFVWLLLTRISGVRMLDATALQRWKDDPAYARYRAATPTLIPRPPRRE